jgi:rhodanese-related sulfurtransferase
MNKTYLFLASLLILLGVGLVIAGGTSDKKEIPPDQLLREVFENTRYISTDELADRLIKKDPTVQLIDVRLAAEFESFALPGVVNITPDNLFSEESRELLAQPGKDFIFYSNDDILSNQTWQILRRSGFSRLYLLKDGLNGWVVTILLPTPPSPVEPQEAFDLYQARVGASQFFKGTVITTTSEEPKEKVETTRKVKKVAAEGGC